jgi:hypothetical protein
VTLRWDAEFTKLLGKNGFCHCFRFFVLNGHNECIFGERVRDAKDVFVLAAGSEHWSEKICMNPDIRLIRHWKWMQWWRFVSGRFSLLAGKASFCVSEDIGVDSWPVVGGH